MPASATLNRALLDATEIGVTKGLKLVEASAKEKAPVRKIFAATEHRRPIKGPIGVNVQALNETRGPAYRWPTKEGRMAFFQEYGASSRERLMVGAKKRSIVETIQYRDWATNEMIEEDRTEGGRARGRINSNRPVIKTEEFGRIGGPFRRVTRSGNLVNRFVGEQWRNEVVHIDLRNYLTARGRGELKSGRGFVKGEGGQLEVGGRLQKSIHCDGPYRTGQKIEGSVRARAHDPDSDFNYAWAQEYGTGHNRPQPYMRPALREQHSAIVNAVKQAIGSMKVAVPEKQVVRTEINLVGTAGWGRSVQWHLSRWFTRVES